MQSKTKPKTTKPKEDDKEQSARFIVAARELDADESVERFAELFSKIFPIKKEKI